VLEDDGVLENDGVLEDDEVLKDDEVINEVEGKIEEVKEEAIESNNSGTNILEEELTNDSETNFQEALFSDDNFEGTEVESGDVDNTFQENIAGEESILDEDTEVVDSPSIDISILLENKKITRIIEVVFDYDMEEFASAIEKISECKNEVAALAAIDDIAKSLFIDVSSKEIKVFKNLISDFFK